MSDIIVTVSGQSGSCVTAGGGDTINVSTGLLVGPLPQLQLAAGSGIAIETQGGVSTISTNLSAASINASLGDLADVSNSQASVGQGLLWGGGEWAAGDLPPGTTLNGLSGNLTLAGGGNVSVVANGSTLTIDADTAVDFSGYATESYVDVAIANLVGTAPTLLNTLGELSNALAGDESFSATVTAAIAGKAALNHTHNISDIAGLNAALDGRSLVGHTHTVSDIGGLSTVASSGSYGDLVNVPSDFQPSFHTHPVAEISGFSTAAAANAPVQSVNNATGSITIANGTGLTLTANGSTLTLDAALPPSNLADLSDVSGTPSTNQALIYNGTEWQPGYIPAGTSINGFSGAIELVAGDGLTLITHLQGLGGEYSTVLQLSADAQNGDVDGGTYSAVGNVLTEGGDNLAAESGDLLAVEGSSSIAGDSIQLLRSSIAGATPSSLLDGELAINTEDGLLYWKRANGTIASADIDLATPTVLADLADVSSATPSTGQVLKWTGSTWAPQSDATNGGGGGGGGYGSLLLFG